MKRRVGRKTSPGTREAEPFDASSTPASSVTEPPIRPLLERYCELADVKRTAPNGHLATLSFPVAERSFFRGRATLRVAFSLDALERDPKAEIAVLGGPFVQQLIEAIRTRGARLSLGLISPNGTAPSLSKRAELPIPVRNGTVTRSKTRVAVHPVGQLIARVVLRAGAGVEEAVVETDVLDLSTGARVSEAVAELFGSSPDGPLSVSSHPDPLSPPVLTPFRKTVVTRPPSPERRGGQGVRTERERARGNEQANEHARGNVGMAVIPSLPAAKFFQLVLVQLREKSAERVAARRAAAEQELAKHLERLDRYFQSVLAEQSDAAGIEAVTALAARRRMEEVRRSQVKAVVHPLQLVEAGIVMQRAEWQIESPEGIRVTFAAQRALAGAATWQLACPHCGRVASELVVCRSPSPAAKGGQGLKTPHGHCSCDVCSQRCSVCDRDFCTDHGIAECRVDGKPACAEHVRTCASCRLEHCSAHEGTCAEDGHKACSSCLAPCASCGRLICNRHAEQGKRRLCTACARHCEGGENEVVGVDELAQCATCGKAVCASHRAVCAVDGQAHCSQHLRKTRTSRLVCARHAASCTQESALLRASDEVLPCATCGKLVCETHSEICVASPGCGRHCSSHLEPLVEDGAFACPEHRGTCHVDGKSHRVASVHECPICGKTACASHQGTCKHCGRRVCSTDLNPKSRRCTTCARLAAVANAPDAVRTAAAAVIKGNSKWRVAHDHTHVVAEVELAWNQKAVLTVRHGQEVAESVVKHSLLKR